ncbi:MAG: OmpP1/FadL family transporter [Paracoccaceae bacterium]
MTSSLGSRLAVSLAAAGAFATPDTSFAGAFQINERSAKSQGMSLADSVSGAKDATYAGFNPAALSTVGSFEAAGNLSFIAPISEGETERLVVQGQPAPLSTAGALGFTTETNADRSAGVPALSLGYRVTDAVVIGLNTRTEFGLATENPDNFIGAPDGIASSLISVTASPTISYEVTDRLALGAAFDVLYADARLTSTAIALDGDDFAYSFSVGGLWEPLDGTQLGVAYHNGYSLDVEGEGVFSPAAPAPLNLFAGQALDATVRTELPNWVQAGVTQDIGGRARVSAEFRWFNWSRFDRLDTAIGALDFENQDAQNYEDAFFVALGGEYDVTPAFTLRSGLAYDETPTQDTTALTEEGVGRTVRVPDGDRLWLSGGLSYDLGLFGQDMTLDAAYSYLLALEDPTVTIRSGPFAGSEVEYRGGAHIFSIGTSLRF